MRRSVGGAPASSELDDPNGPAPRAQTLDNVTVEQISAGKLIEPAGDDEDELPAKRSFVRHVRCSRSKRWELGHPSGAS